VKQDAERLRPMKKMGRIAPRIVAFRDDETVMPIR
jgi:hypothetical protein